MADVARAHLRALDTEIRALQLRRAVLRSIADRQSTTEEMRLMHSLARLSAQERQQMINDFVDRTFDGVDPQAPGARIAQAMRQLPAELPDDPTAGQVDAWLELAELVGDDSFQRRVRQMAVSGGQPGQRPYDPARVLEHAGQAVAAGSSRARPRPGRSWSGSSMRACRLATGPGRLMSWSGYAYGQ